MGLSNKEKYSFGIGAIGKDAICCFVGAFLMYYFTDVLYLAPAFVGTLFFVARIWDAINDPMMGLIVDNTHNKFGKFRTWLTIGTILNAFVFIGLFMTFGLKGKALYIYVSIVYILYGMTYTIMDVPYWSWLPNLTNDPHERESLAVVPRFFASFAQFVVGVGGLAFVYKFDSLFGNGDNTTGFTGVAVIIAILFIVTIGITVINVKEKYDENKKNEKSDLKHIITVLSGNKYLKPYIGLLLAYNLCTQIIQSIIIYYFKYVAGNEKLFAIFSMCILAEMFGLTIFPRVVKKIGREKTFGLACSFPIIGLIIIAIAGFIAPSNPLFIAIGSGIFKIGSGFELGITTVLIADVIDYNEIQFGTRNESIICSTQTFLMKSSQAISGLLSGFGLAIVGYDATLTVQSSYTINGLRVIMIVFPMFFAFLSYIIYIKGYKLRGNALSLLRKALREKMHCGNCNAECRYTETV